MTIIVIIISIFFAISLSFNMFLILERQKFILQLKHQEDLHIAKDDQLKLNNEILNHSLKETLVNSMKDISKDFHEISNNTTKQYNEEREKLLKDSSQIKIDTIDLAGKKLSEITQNFDKTLNEYGNKIKEVSITSDLLTKSFIGGQNTGNIGEIGLTQKLIHLGLKENESFFTQFAGQSIRPDAVIMLPNDDFMVIDAKNSKEFEDITSSGKTEEEQNNAIFNTYEKHIKSLASKNYVDGVAKVLKDKTGKEYNIHQGSLVILYIPTDYALERVKNSNPKIIDLAKQNNVILAGPSALEALLSVVSYNIQISNAGASYNENVEKLKYSIRSFFKLLEPISGIGKGLELASKSYYTFLTRWEGKNVNSENNFKKTLYNIFKDEIKEDDLKKMKMPSYHFASSVENVKEDSDKLLFD